MKPMTKLLTVTAVVTSLLSGTFAAYASNKGGENDALGVNQAAISLSDAVNAAMAATPGKAAKAEFETDDNSQQAVWAVEIVGADGKVTDVTVDATNGSILKQQADQADDGEDEGEHEGKGEGKNEAKEQR